MGTKIEWVTNSDGTRGETWNPITGCTPISPGCAHCYARRMANRLRGRFGYPEDDPFRVTLHSDKLEQPLRWRKSRRVFVCSMGDLFHESIGVIALLELWSVMERCPQHIFMVLTKRPIKMAEFMAMNPMGGPLPNVWLGVTVESPDYLWRVEELLSIPAAVRFASVEPMLGPVGFNYHQLGLCEVGAPCGDHGILDWVICGVETGPGARPMDLDWARDLRDQCVGSGVPFFFKRDSNGNRELDGRLWEQYPEANP